MYMLSEVALWMMEYIGSSLILVCIQSDIKQELHMEMATGGEPTKIVANVITFEM